MELSVAAGWNQSPTDWGLMIQHGRAVGIRTSAGRLIATVVTMCYGPTYGWIAMLLVAEDRRRQGIGKYLFEDGVEHLNERGRVPVLDATPAGEELYRRSGFSGSYRVYRMARPGEGLRPAAADAPPSTSRESVAEAKDDEIDALTATDTAVTDFERADILRDIGRRTDSRVFRDVDKGASVALLRRGHHAWHIGPVYSEHPEGARRVMDRALSVVGDAPVYMDVVAEQEELIRYMESKSFVMQRPFLRMVVGEAIQTAPPGMLVATAGPEYG